MPPHHCATLSLWVCAPHASCTPHASCALISVISELERVALPRMTSLVRGRCWCQGWCQRLMCCPWCQALMRELELRERRVKELQSTGERLLREEHPGRQTLEVGTAGIQGVGEAGKPEHSQSWGWGVGYGHWATLGHSSTELWGQRGTAAGHWHGALGTGQWAQQGTDVGHYCGAVAVQAVGWHQCWCHWH